MPVSKGQPDQHFLMPEKQAEGAAAKNVSIDVSFIIVSWNTKDCLLKCLRSLAQTGKGCVGEIIVVDNASADGSSQVVQENFPNVRLVQNEKNVGFARANNAGIQLARGRYLCLINSDVEMLDGCVATLLREMDAQPKIGMIGPKLLERDGRTQISCWGFPSLWNMFCCALFLDRLFPKVALFNGYQMMHRQRDGAQDVDILGGAFWLTRREAVQKVGGLDEGFFMYGEDMDWCKRFWQKGWRIHFHPSACAIHYGGASSANAPTRFYIEMQRANLQYWRKHHSGVAWIAIYLIYCLHHLVRIATHFGAMLVRASRRADHRFKVQRSMACLAWLFGCRSTLSATR